MRLAVTSEQVSASDTDGVVCLRRVIERDWLVRGWQVSDEAMIMAPENPELRYFRRIGLWRQI